MDLNLDYIGCFKSLEETKQKMQGFVAVSKVTRKMRMNKKLRKAHKIIEAKLVINQSGVRISTGTELLADLVQSAVCGCFAAHGTFVGVVWADRVSRSYDFFLFQAREKFFETHYGEISENVKKLFLAEEDNVDWSFQHEEVQFLGRRVLRRHVLRSPREIENNRRGRYY